MSPNEILKNQFKKLPKSIQDLILSTEFQSNLNNISLDNNVGEEKNTSLENETILILIGLESINDYGANLVSEVGVTQEQAQSITGEVFEKIITPIESSLRAFLEKELEEEKREVLEEGVRPAVQTKEGEDTDTEEIKKALRENTKTISVKNLIANME